MKKRLALALIALASLAGCGGHPGPQGHQPSRTAGYRTRYGIQAHPPTFGLHPKGLPLPKPLSPLASSSTLTMLDSVDTTVFSGLSPSVVAGYLPPSSWPTFTPFVSQFPRSYHVAVAVRDYVFGDRRAAITCLDDEPGDATPSEAGPWVVHEIKLGFRPCVYGSLSNIPAIKASVAAAHPSAKVYYWCADWTFFAHLDAGCDAVQWTDHYLGRNIDASIVTLDFVGAKPQPEGPVCFGAGWQHTRFCLHVRREDAELGQRRDRQLAYLKVSRANAARLAPPVTRLRNDLAAIEARAEQELHAHQFAALKISAGNAAVVQAKLAPLATRLSNIHARVTREQAAATHDNAVLVASLRKYGYRTHKG